MALLFIDSFDHYQNADIFSKWTNNFTQSAIGVGKGRCDGNCMLMSVFNSLVKGIPFGSAHATIGFAFRYEPQSLTGQSLLVTRVGNVSREHLSLYVNGDGSLQVDRILASGGERLGLTPPGLINWDRWYFIEWQVFIHPTAGSVTVRLNNTVVIAASGVNTVGDSGGGVLIEAILRKIAFYCSSNQAWRLDDLYVLDDTGPAPCNTFLGDCKVEYLRPRAPGSHQAWSLVGSKPSHWQAVDDNQTPDGDGSYVESVVPGQTDTNLYLPTGLPAGPIFGAQLSLLARKSDPGPRVIAPVVNNVAGTPNGFVSDDSYQYHHTPYQTNPATGLPWTIAEVNTIDAGVTVVS